MGGEVRRCRILRILENPILLKNDAFYEKKNTTDDNDDNETKHQTIILHPT